MNLKGFKLFACAMVASLMISQVTPAFANEHKAFVDVSERAASKYEHDDYAFTKISHPEKAASTTENPSVDGIVDYIGHGVLGATNVDEGSNGQGARGQSYSWASVGYGDYMYVSTLENAMGSTIKFMGQGGLGHDFDPELFNSALGALYRGDFFIEEEDKGTAGSALSKINVKTGEVTLLMSKAKNGLSCQFRNGLLYKDKLYFCGAVNNIPSIYEVDPKTDEFKLVYSDDTMKSPDAWKEAMKKQMCPAIRGMAVYNDYLVISCLGLDANPYIAVSNNPSKGFTKIASSYNEDGSNGDLFGYPAFRFQDSIYGGGIWEMIEFNDDLYIAMCTGTPENSKDNGKSFQSFAVVRGHCNGAIDDPNAWEFTPIVGDQERDGAKYTFGIDPERTRSGACNMMVYNDHLYIGEYNDIEIAIIRMLFDLDFQFMADNLEQSVSLYRMDKDENFELVAGNPTTMFKESLTGLKSGFGKDKPRYENQYIWKMDNFQNNLYIGTFDQSSLSEPIAQFSNGDLLHMSKEEWKVQFDYLYEFIKVALKNLKKPVPGTFQSAPLPKAERNVINNAAKDVTKKDLPVLLELLDAQTEMEEFLYDNTDVTILSLPNTFDADQEITSLKEFHQMAMLLQAFLENEESWTHEQRVQAHYQFYKMYEELYDYYCLHPELPDFVKDIYNKIINNKGVQKIKNFVRCLYYLSDSERGFDMFEFNSDEELNTITTNGMSDPYNHGLRAFAINHDEKNPWLCIGTANPFYGTQVWRMEKDGLNLPPTEDKDSVDPNKPVDPENPGDTDKPIDPNNPGDTETDKPGDTETDKPGDTETDKPGDVVKPDTNNPTEDQLDQEDSSQLEDQLEDEQVGTGDSSNKTAYTVTFLIAVAILAGVILLRRKRK